MEVSILPSTARCANMLGMAREMPDYIEGVRAFMEKRKPNFTGRKGNS